MMSHDYNIPVGTGWKLNVLSTFNLRSVFTGMRTKKQGEEDNTSVGIANLETKFSQAAKMK